MNQKKKKNIFIYLFGSRNKTFRWTRMMTLDCHNSFLLFFRIQSGHQTSKQANLIFFVLTIDFVHTRCILIKREKRVKSNKKTNSIQKISGKLDQTNKQKIHLNEISWMDWHFQFICFQGKCQNLVSQNDHCVYRSPLTKNIISLQRDFNYRHMWIWIGKCYYKVLLLFSVKENKTMNN